jgi:hypothetical protein
VVLGHAVVNGQTGTNPDFAGALSYDQRLCMESRVLPTSPIFEDSNSSANVDTSRKLAGQWAFFSDISRNTPPPKNGSNSDSVPATVPATEATRPNYDGWSMPKWAAGSRTSDQPSPRAGIEPGEHIFTMNLAVTAVRTSVPARRARP